MNTMLPLSHIHTLTTAILELTIGPRSSLEPEEGNAAMRAKAEQIGQALVDADFAAQRQLVPGTGSEQRGPYTYERAAWRWEESEPLAMARRITAFLLLLQTFEEAVCHVATWGSSEACARCEHARRSALLYLGIALGMPDVPTIASDRSALGPDFAHVC